MSSRLMTLKRVLPLPLGLALVVSACSGGGDPGQAEGADATSAGANSDQSADSQNTDQGGSGDQAEPADTTPTTRAEVADEPGLPMADGTEIEQLTAKSGGGPRPLLAWSPVADAGSYTVVVYDAEGEPWWSWSGPGTEVVIGGVDTDSEIGGPRADTGVRWIVMSFDANGQFNGTSPKRSIEP